MVEQARQLADNSNWQGFVKLMGGAVGKRKNRRNGGFVQYFDSIASGFTRAIHGARLAGVASRRAKRLSCRFTRIIPILALMGRLRRSGLLQANRCRTTGSHPTGCYKRKNRRNGGFVQYFDSITSGFIRAIHGAHPAGVASRRAKRLSCRLVEEGSNLRDAPTKKPPKWRFICWRTHQDSNLRPLPPENVRIELEQTSARLNLTNYIIHLINIKNLYSTQFTITKERFFTRFVTETVTDFCLKMTSAHDKTEN